MKLIGMITDQLCVGVAEFWTILSDCDVTVRGLTALVYAFIANCDKV